MYVFHFGDFELDLTRYELRRAGREIEIGPRNFDVLVYLVRNADRLVSKNELIEQVWGVSAMSASSVPTSIAAIRKALGDEPSAPTYIETVRGRGYRFAAEVRRPGQAGAAAAGGATPAQSAFVGREPELQALYAAFERALEGSPQLMLVAGEAGIGKTRLIEEFAPGVREDGAATLVGRCREGGGAPAFWPWVQILRGVIEQAPASVLDRVLETDREPLGRLLPELVDREPRQPFASLLDAEQARFRLFEALTRFLRAAAAERPLVAWLDDLHLADASSIALLHFVVRELRNASVLFIVTYRDVDLQRDPRRNDELAALAREEPARSIQLHGLSREEVARFVTGALAQGEIDESVAKAVYDQTAGNPFFVTQVVHLLSAEGQLSAADLEHGPPSLLWGGVRESVARQLDALGPGAHRALTVASVFGRDFPASALASVLESDTGHVLGAIESAVAARLLTPASGSPGHYRFTHMLVRDAIYERMDPLDRLLLHARAGDALEELFGPDRRPHAAELAWHFLEAATLQGASKAIHYAVWAAEWATSRLAYEDAPGHYERALAALALDPEADRGRRCALTLALGEARRRAGDRGAAERTLREAADLARQMDSPELLARVALALAPGFFSIEVGVYDPYLVALLEESLESLPADELALRARLLARLGMALTWSERVDQRSGLVEQALEISERSGDTTAKVDSLCARHGDLWSPEHLAERVALTRRISELSPEVEAALLNLSFKLTANLEAGDIVSVDNTISEFEALESQIKMPQSLWYVGLYRSMRALMKGRFEEAENLATRFAEIGRRAGSLNADQSFGAQLGIIRWEQGFGDHVVPVVEAFSEQYPAVIVWRACLAFFRMNIGRYDEARSAYEQIALHNFQNFAWNETSMATLVFSAEVCAQLRDKKRAFELYELIKPSAQRFSVGGYGSVFLGSIDRSLGLLARCLGRQKIAKSHLESAVRENTKVGALPWLARSERDLGLTLRASKSSRDKRQGNELLARAKQRAEELGMNQLIAEIDSIISS